MKDIGLTVNYLRLIYFWIRNGRIWFTACGVSL